MKSEASTWLTVLPLQQDGYDLSATQFRDQLAIRYGREPTGLQSACDGCGAPFSLQHSLTARRVGLSSTAMMTCVTVMHSWRILLGEVSRGVWEGSRVAIFDNRIIDADAPSYLTVHLSWESLANRAATEKKNKYSAAAEELRGSFTPLVCSTDGALHRE